VVAQLALVAHLARSLVGLVSVLVRCTSEGTAGGLTGGSQGGTAATAKHAPAVARSAGWRSRPATFSASAGDARLSAQSAYWRSRGKRPLLGLASPAERLDSPNRRRTPYRVDEELAGTQALQVVAAHALVAVVHLCGTLRERLTSPSAVSHDATLARTTSPLRFTPISASSCARKASTILGDERAERRRVFDSSTIRLQCST